jgi:hypothetical protein
MGNLLARNLNQYPKKEFSFSYWQKGWLSLHPLHSEGFRRASPFLFPGAFLPLAVCGSVESEVHCFGCTTPRRQTFPHNEAPVKTEAVIIRIFLTIDYAVAKSQL